MATTKSAKLAAKIKSKIRPHFKSACGASIPCPTCDPNCKTVGEGLTYPVFAAFDALAAYTPMFSFNRTMNGKSRRRHNQGSY